MTCDLKRHKLSLRIIRFVRTAADVNRDGVVSIFDLILGCRSLRLTIRPGRCAYRCQSDVELRMVDEE